MLIRKPQLREEKSIRKAGLFICAVAVTFLLLDRSIARVFESVVSRSQFRFSKVYQGGLTADVLVLGNSRGVNGFFVPEISRQTGQDVFNLSFNGMDMLTLEALFLDYLKYNKSPRTLIIEVTALQSHDSISAVKFLIADSPRLDEVLKKRSFSNWLFCHISHVYRYNTEVFLRELFYLNRSDQDWINDGVIEPSAIADFKIREADLDVWSTVHRDCTDALSRLIKTARESAIQVKLIISPYAPGYIDQVDVFESWKESVLSSTGSQEVIRDYSKALPEPSDFADFVHLNKAGSKEFLRYLIDDGIFEMEAPN